ncbi:MAG: hypothetical protein KDB10_07035 [Acidimicrobiales bacterium]|nr:hypothetical protein [Acidimicrobiales bacterium]MCB9374176.1 hypothetical protein [Microthrixaceae bacterium]
MITKGSRFFFGFAALAYVGAIVYGLSTGGHVFGVFSLGYKESVGEHLGYAVLLGAAAVSAFLGFFTVALRDADPEAEAQVVHLDHVPPAESINRTNFWPIVAAFSLGAMAIGLVVGSPLFVAGAIGLGIVVIEWGIRNWADRRTGDPEVNREIRNRIMLPVEIPVGALLCIALLVVLFSRVLLATPKSGSTGLAIVVALLVLGVATLIATRPRLSANLIAALLLLGGIAVLVGGITAASVGTRDFEEHHEDTEYEQPPVGGELPPERPESTTTTEASN